MGISNGASLLGLEAFSYITNLNTLSNESILKTTHNKLTMAGYIFAGFHGTSASAAESLISGSPPRPSVLGVEKKRGGDKWDGFYVTNAVEYAKGYCLEFDDDMKKRPCAIIRAYLPASKATHFFMNEKRINLNLNRKGFQRLVNHKHHVEKGEFLIAGPDSEGEEHHEMVISTQLLPHLIFIPSLHKVEFEYGSPKIQWSALESKVVNIDIHKRSKF